MAGHEGPASLRPRCIRSGSPVAAMPVCHTEGPDVSGAKVQNLVSRATLSLDLCNPVLEYFDLREMK
jgi:hypothetical protein